DKSVWDRFINWNTNLITCQSDYYQAPIMGAQNEKKYTVQISRDGAMREIDVVTESGKSYQTGDKATITAYKDGTLYIQ
ncbi:hypothetical protein O1441_20635, partial [Bacteroides fragilis]|nr:hypothetical protein [Bacteroides fragilis]